MQLLSERLEMDDLGFRRPKGDSISNWEFILQGQGYLLMVIDNYVF